MSSVDPNALPTVPIDIIALSRDDPVHLDAGALRRGWAVAGTRFEIGRRLGMGGMAIVYEAEHLALGRCVALKIPRAAVAGCAGDLERFRREAGTTALVHSPHVVRVFDYGILPDGREFSAMELLDGHDLASELAFGGIEPARVIGLLRQMCVGLAAVHDAGLVHRDVKPTNVMVVRDACGRERVVLLDFGVASRSGAIGDLMACGTPEYMAPEQIEGRAFDGRLDIYALGCTAYHLLVGRPPFIGTNATAILSAHVSTAPPPLTAWRPDLDRTSALNAVVMRCLAKRPEDRYDGVRDLDAALLAAQISDRLHRMDDLSRLAIVFPRARSRIAATLSVS